MVGSGLDLFSEGLGPSVPSNRICHMNGADLTDRFLNAYRQAQESLEAQDHRKYKGLGEAIRDSKNPVVRQNRRTLERLADLRNVIQHSDYVNGQPIATPRLNAVENMERLAESIRNPLTVSRVMVKNPQNIAETAPLRDATALIVKHDFSQIPVVDKDQRYLWLLTTNALARWVSANFEENGELIVAESTVQDIEGYSEKQDLGRVVSPTLTAQKACNILTGSEAPAALVVTDAGPHAGRIQGIITKFDVPLILQRLSLD